MKPRGGEGENSRLKCPLGFLVLKKVNSPKLINEIISSTSFPVRAYSLITQVVLRRPIKF